MPIRWVGMEEAGVGLPGEGAGDGFAEAEREEARADGGFLCGGGVGDDDAVSGKRVGETVVAVDAGHLFDQVDLAFEVETPRGEFYFEGVCSLWSEFAAERGEVLMDDL